MMINRIKPPKPMYMGRSSHRLSECRGDGFQIGQRVAGVDEAWCDNKVWPAGNAGGRCWAIALRVGVSVRARPW